MQVSIREFIEQSNQAKGVADLCALFEKAISSYGYDRYMYSMLTDDPLHEWHKAPAIIRNYPEDWMVRYVAEGFMKLDPVRHLAFATRLPFRWDDLPKIRDLTAQQKIVMHECDEAGLHKGIGVPFHGPFGEVAGVGLASTNRSAETDRIIVTTLGIISHQFHNAHLGLALDPGAVRRVRLTDREREVLAWCAQGKSNWVIGEILDMSESTVKHHVAGCIAKLGADTKITAVLKAIRLGLISL